jgi:hypothetical protein
MAPRAERNRRKGKGRIADGGGKGKGICRLFQRTGNCSYGADCRFSHEISSSSNGEGPSQQSREKSKEQTAEQQRTRAEYNSWKRLIKKTPQANDIETVRQLWNGALTILNGDDREWKQMLPRDLDDEDNYGRQHIRTLLSMVTHNGGHHTFVDLSRPFLLVITHPALLDCLTVDTFVGGLYNFISGSNGSRAIPFFQRLSTSLVEDHVKPAASNSTTKIEEVLVAMSIALLELLKRERRATFHDDLPDLVEAMENITTITGLDKNSVAFQFVTNTIRELRGIIARANGLLNHEVEEPGQVDGVSTAVVASTYPREIILPRDRHDNDKLDIAEIKLLPTENEIRSNHLEFLPSTDLSQPHFLKDPSARHLDTHFRLLRHDVFGELKEALGGLMIAVENEPRILENPKLNFGNIRVYPYLKAHIRYIDFDHRRGLGVQISFIQPFQLRKKSASDRRKWWEESKRLEEGVLLCLLSFDGTKSSLLFFTVSDKCTDPKKEPSLTSHNYMGMIVAKLATQNQSDLASLIRLSCENARGILIELPGVIPATFMPILENLQNMQRLSRLPFRQWILPDRTGPKTNGVVDISPPLYSRGSNFAFSLKSILKAGGDDLSISSKVSVSDSAMIDEMVARTELDRGQCQAMIAALTREFAFIQGPPGTGKWS